MKWDPARLDEMRGVEAGVELGEEVRGVQPSAPDETRGAQPGWNYASRV